MEVLFNMLVVVLVTLSCLCWLPSARTSAYIGKSSNGTLLLNADQVLINGADMVGLLTSLSTEVQQLKRDVVDMSVDIVRAHAGCLQSFAEVRTLGAFDVSTFRLAFDGQVNSLIFAFSSAGTHSTNKCPIDTPGGSSPLYKLEPGVGLTHIGSFFTASEAFGILPFFTDSHTFIIVTSADEVEVYDAPTAPFVGTSVQARQVLTHENSTTFRSSSLLEVFGTTYLFVADLFKSGQSVLYTWLPDAQQFSGAYELVLDDGAVPLECHHFDELLLPGLTDSTHRHLAMVCNSFNGVGVVEMTAADPDVSSPLTLRHLDTLSVSQAQDVVSMVIAGSLYVAVSSFDETFGIGVLFKWDNTTSQFTSHQEFEGAPWRATELEYFSVGDTHYLLVSVKVRPFYNVTLDATHPEFNGDSLLYVWSKYSETFVVAQAIPTHAANDWAFARDGTDMYLAVAQEKENPAPFVCVHNTTSVVYQWSLSPDPTGCAGTLLV
eukprot:m.149996 g.149996  ORF g.149996 m.149996 type:complete len:491 (+) comp14216_c1_seq1:370-1842(+)